MVVFGVAGVLVGLFLTLWGVFAISAFTSAEGIRASRLDQSLAMLIFCMGFIISVCSCIWVYDLVGI